MNNSLKSVCCILVAFFGAALTYAQFGGNNIAEYQYGRLPGDTNSISTLYDRMTGYYNFKFIKISATLEQFNTPQAGSNYIKLSQFAVQYKRNHLEIKLGNLYETIGRGSLLRSFEIPGAILEDLSYRSRHYFNRDIFGASLKFQQKNFMVKGLYGSPLNNVLPPTQEAKSRRADTVAAIFSEYTVLKHTIGVAAMRHTNSGHDNSFLMATLSGFISPVLSYYTEFAKNASSVPWDNFSSQSSYVLYGGINVSYHSFGLSAEYKNYKNFLIGSGINEPPALIKEHSYKLLNRSTPVLQPLNESGYQVELFYTFPDLSAITFNNSLAINYFGKQYVFHEYFLEYDFTLSDLVDIKTFADYARDPFKLEENRITAGLITDWKASKSSAIRTEYEFQTFTRLNNTYQNHVLALGFTYKSKLVCNVVTEFSDDSFVVTSGSKIWIGGNVKYQLNKNHSIQLFAGQRRGGPACNAGVCYEVLDFEGIELRLTSRF